MEEKLDKLEFGWSPFLQQVRRSHHQSQKKLHPSAFHPDNYTISMSFHFEFVAVYCFARKEIKWLQLWIFITSAIKIKAGNIYILGGTKKMYPFKQQKQLNSSL